MNNYTKRLLGIGLLWHCVLGIAEAGDKLTSHLQTLQSEYQRHTSTQPANTFSSSDHSLQVVKHRFVAVDITSKNEAEAIALMDKLKRMGVSQLSRYKKLLSALVPIDRLSDLNGFSEVSWVSSNKASRRAFGPPGGYAYNAADAAMFTDVVRKRYDIDGSGVTIGVLSDSYNCLGGEAGDIASGDLPADVKVLKEYPFCEDGASDEGRAMMQLIHDIAPGAKLMFYTAFVSAVDFAAGIQALADAGADIIVDDVGYFAMPMFQEGPIAQSVNEVKARGVSYFSSAGNSARLSYENTFTPGRDFLSADHAHDFGKAAGGSSDFYQKITLPPNQPIVITLQWDNPAEVAGDNGAETDLDIFLLDPLKRLVVTSSQDNNIGHDPVEIISGFHTSDNTEFYLYISHRAGPAPNHVKYILHGPVAPWPDEQALITLNVSGNTNGQYTVTMPDGTPTSNGRAAIQIFNCILCDNNRINVLGGTDLLVVGTPDMPIFKGPNGTPVIELDDNLYEVGPGTDYSIWFIPDGYSVAQGPDGLQLFKELDNFIPVSIDQYATYSSTVFGHPNASGAMAVGAIPYYETPWFGSAINHSRIESFSSAGGTPIFFRPDGARLAQVEMRPKQFIVAPDNTDTTFFGNDSDNNGLPNFAGTSAAAPNAAAAAALLKEAFPHLTPDMIYQAMLKGAIDLHDPAGSDDALTENTDCSDTNQFDWGTGCGLIQADLMFDEVSASTDDLYLSLNTSTPQITAGQLFNYELKLMNFSGRDLKNVRIRALELPQYVQINTIEGCLEIDQREVSCRLGDVAAGEIRSVTLETLPFNNPAGKLSFAADVLSDTPVDLTHAQTRLDKNLVVLPGDVNHDGCVDLGDWGQLYGVFRAGLQAEEYDLNQDGQFNMADFDTLESLYSNPPSGAACR